MTSRRCCHNRAVVLYVYAIAAMAVTPECDAVDDSRHFGAVTAGGVAGIYTPVDDEKKRASREAEQQLVGEIEKAVAEKLACDVVSESRVQRDGAFPQINVLIDRDEESRLQELHLALADRYAGEGVTLAITGPWPPYSFTENVES